MGAKRRQRKYDPATKTRARELRKAGYTYQEINEALGGDIPKSTLSNWVSDVLLTPEQRQRIVEKEREGAARGRRGGLWGGGAGWNREMKRRRLEDARQQAEPVVDRLVENKDALILMASALYMGEGAKAEDAFGFGNSDPRLVRAWVTLLRRNFDIDESKFRCQLAISEGMDEETLKEYWSKVTSIPVSQFMKSSIKRGPVKRTRPGYQGVCLVHYYSIAVRRYIDAVGEGVLSRLLDDN